jgi:hypothetical protein
MDLPGGWSTGMKERRKVSSMRLESDGTYFSSSPVFIIGNTRRSFNSPSIAPGDN